MKGVTDSLAAGDAIAAGLLAELEPLRFAEADDEHEREECFRLRYRAVMELGLAAPDRFPGGLERDEFDDDAVQILGWDGTRAIATCRLVLPCAGRPLPLQTAFGLRAEEAADAVEWGRLVVDPDYRGDGHSVFLGLAGRGWLSMRARGYGVAIATTPLRLIALFDALGFAVTVLGPPRSWWGEQRYPIRCGGSPTIEGLERERSRRAPQ